MDCPVCGSKTSIKHCFADCESVYRRRKCVECGYDFYTSEIEAPDSRSDYWRLHGEYKKARYSRKKG